MPLLLLTACANVRLTGNLEEYCRQTEPLWDQHVDALISDGGPQSLVTGDTLVTVRDSVCLDLLLEKKAKLDAT